MKYLVGSGNHLWKNSLYESMKSLKIIGESKTNIQRVIRTPHSIE